MNAQQRANVPNAMRQAGITAAANQADKDGHMKHPFTVDLLRSKNGYDQAFDGKGWNAHLSHKTYVAIKEKCGL
jgi:hypothetical protein